MQDQRHRQGAAEGAAPDAAKLQKCEEKFEKACLKAQSRGDCQQQTQTCAEIEAEADACVAILTSGPVTTSTSSTSTTSTTLGSPSGAFLD